MVLGDMTSSGISTFWAHVSIFRFKKELQFIHSEIIVGRAKKMPAGPKKNMSWIFRQKTQICDCST